MKQTRRFSSLFNSRTLLIPVAFILVILVPLWGRCQSAEFYNLGNTCERILENRPLHKTIKPAIKKMLSAADGADREFWDLPDIEAAFASPSSQLIHFGLAQDSELPVVDVLRYLVKDPYFLADLKYSIGILPFDLHQLLSHYKMSEKQFRAFVVRPEARTKSSEFVITDFNVGYMTDFFAHWTDLASSADNVKTFNNVTVPRLKSVLSINAKRILAQMGIPVQQLHFDPLGALEVSTDGYKVSPADFKQELMLIHKLFKDASSHLHLSVPADEFPLDKLLEVGRISELQIIFKQMTSSYSGNPGLASINWNHLMAGSLIGSQIDNLKQKGVVKIEWSRFKNRNGGRSHDLETRHYADLDHGLGILKNEIYLVQNIARLDPPKQKFPTGLLEKAGNLKGALLYFHYWAVRSGDMDFVHLGQEAESLAQSVENFSADQYQKISTFIVEHKLDEVVSDPEFFLSRQ